MRKNKQAKAQLTPHRLAIYRGYEPRSIAEQIAALNAFSIHHEYFLDTGRPTLAEAAARAWLCDGVVLAATVATTAEEVNRKVYYLQACLDAWVAPTARAKGHLAIAGMIMAAIATETDRWGLKATAARH